MPFPTGVHSTRLEYVYPIPHPPTANTHRRVPRHISLLPAGISVITTEIRSMPRHAPCETEFPAAELSLAKACAMVVIDGIYRAKACVMAFIEPPKGQSNEARSSKYF